MFHCLFSLFHNVFLFLFSLVHHFSLVFSLFFIIFPVFFLSVSSFFIVFFIIFLLFFNVFQLFNVIFELLIRLKNTKTDKIEYFRDPGVTWLQIIYLEAFHCVDFFPYVSLFLLYFSYSWRIR